MRASSKLIDYLKAAEGCKLTAYQDSVGVWTIGYGHTAGVKRGDRITQYQAEQFLREDLARFEAAAGKVRNVATQGRFDAQICHSTVKGAVLLLRLVQPYPLAHQIYKQERKASQQHKAAQKAGRELPQPAKIFKAAGCKAQSDTAACAQQQHKKQKHTIPSIYINSYFIILSNASGNKSYFSKNRPVFPAIPLR